MDGKFRGWPWTGSLDAWVLVSALPLTCCVRGSRTPLSLGLNFVINHMRTNSLRAEFHTYRVRYLKAVVASALAVFSASAVSPQIPKLACTWKLSQGTHAVCRSRNPLLYCTTSSLVLIGVSF